MKIAFVGDSFCNGINRFFNEWEIKNRPNFLGWPEVVARQFNADILCRGMIGGCLFNAYQDLLQIIDNADYVILCITQPYRLANKHNLPITSSAIHSAESIRNFLDCSIKEAKEIEVSIQNYYDNLINFEYHLVVHRLFIDEMNRILSQRKKKCIWFFVDLKRTNSTITSGCYGSHSLSSLTEYYLLCNGITDNIGYYKSTTPAGHKLDAVARLNHFGEKINFTLAQLVIDIINEHKFYQGTEIDMTKYFAGLHEDRQRMEIPK